MMRGFKKYTQFVLVLRQILSIADLACVQYSHSLAAPHRTALSCPLPVDEVLHQISGVMSEVQCLSFRLPMDTDFLAINRSGQAVTVSSRRDYSTSSLAERSSPSDHGPVAEEICQTVPLG